jgi:hypothetical protein
VNLTLGDMFRRWLADPGLPDVGALVLLGLTALTATAGVVEIVRRRPAAAHRWSRATVALGILGLVAAAAALLLRVSAGSQAMSSLGANVTPADLTAIQAKVFLAAGFAVIAAGIGLLAGWVVEWLAERRLDETG